MSEQTDVRWLRERLDDLRLRLEEYYHADDDRLPTLHREDMEWMAEAADALERMEALEAGDVSDGYHTHRELYEYRMLYNAHAVRGWLAAGIPVVKSWKHSDGEPCFGGGWFIVTAELPTGQVSNHYAAEHWHLFDVPEVDLPPEYDGHTPADAAERLRAALATPAPAEQTGGAEPESPAAPEIVTVSVTFMQDPDGAQENDLQQELHIEVVDSGAGHYAVIRTDRWAMDTPEALANLICRVMAMMEVPADD